MPVNLNALLRYKTIDSMLLGGQKYTIGQIQNACTEALGEIRNKDDMVSERTIRDDIKVLRSDDLGFNAPIKVKDGKYFYADRGYTIWAALIPWDDKRVRDLIRSLMEEKLEGDLMRSAPLAESPSVAHLSFEADVDPMILPDEEPIEKRKSFGKRSLFFSGKLSKSTEESERISPAAAPKKTWEEILQILS